MNTGLSIFVTVISLGTIFGCAALLIWCIKNNTDVKEGESMGHAFDGIEELNNPVPTWWSRMFIVMCVFALVYLLLFPGLGNFKGLLGWKSSLQDIQSLADEKQQATEAASNKIYVQYLQEKEKADRAFGEKFKSLAYEPDGKNYKPIKEIAKDPDALKVGRRLFLQNCSQCHGSTARGGQGFPNLTDAEKQWGGEPEDIKTTLMYGRKAAMPAWLDMLGEQGISEVATYVMSLSGRRVDEVLALKGKKYFTACAACHGPEGKGSKVVGAPNLTNKTWLYGGTRKRIEETLKYGRNGVMPAWKDVLGEDKIQVLSAYVWSLSKDKKE